MGERMGEGWKQPPALLILVGSVLVAAAAALHPPTFDPARADQVLAAVGDGPRGWVAVHALMALGLWLWTAGVGAVAAQQAAQLTAPAGGRLLWAARASLSAALGLWLAALVLEMSSLPLTVSIAGPGVPQWLEGLWPAVLGWGYAAAALQWVALGTVAAVLRTGPEAAARRLGAAGLLAVVVGLPAMGAAWFLPSLARVILAAGLAPGAVWVAVVAMRRPGRG